MEYDLTGMTWFNQNEQRMPSQMPHYQHSQTKYPPQRMSAGANFNMTPEHHMSYGKTNGIMGMGGQMPGYNYKQQSPLMVDDGF